MNSTVATLSAGRKSESDDQAAARRSASDDLGRPPQSAVDDRGDGDRSAADDMAAWLDRVRAAMKETGWTADALDAFWSTSRGYATKLLNAEKPWSVARMLALPRDLRVCLDRLGAEASGHYVVAALDDGEAERQLVSGFVNLFGARRLPSKSAGPLKVIASVAAREVTR